MFLSEYLTKIRRKINLRNHPIIRRYFIKTIRKRKSHPSRQLINSKLLFFTTSPFTIKKPNKLPRSRPRRLIKVRRFSRPVTNFGIN